MGDNNHLRYPPEHSQTDSEPEYTAILVLLFTDPVRVTGQKPVLTLKVEHNHLQKVKELVDKWTFVSLTIFIVQMSMAVLEFSEDVLQRV